jgi:hypothetical protein
VKLKESVAAIEALEQHLDDLQAYHDKMKSTYELEKQKLLDIVSKDKIRILSLEKEKQQAVTQAASLEQEWKGDQKQLSKKVETLSKEIETLSSFNEEQKVLLNRKDELHREAARKWDAERHLLEDELATLKIQLEREKRSNNITQRQMIEEELQMTKNAIQQQNAAFQLERTTMLRNRQSLIDELVKTMQSLATIQQELSLVKQDHKNQAHYLQFITECYTRLQTKLKELHVISYDSFGEEVPQIYPTEKSNNREKKPVSSPGPAPLVCTTLYKILNKV